MKNYISKTLIVLGIFTLSLIVTDSALAEYPTYEDCVNSTWTTPVGCDKVLDGFYASYYSNGYNYGHTTRQYAYTQPNQYSNTQSGTPIINNYYYQSNPTTTKTTTSNTVKSTASTSSNVKSSTSDSDSSKTNTNVKEENNSGFNSDQSSNNELTALSFRGSGGFLPSSFWQWLIVVVLILVIVILARLISRSHRSNVHAVPAH